MLTKSVNIKSCDNRHGRIPCFCSISLCSNYQFDLFVHTDPYSPLNYPRIMFQEPPDTRRKTIANVLWNNCWPDGQNDDCGSKVVLLLKNPLHSWGVWLEPLTLGATDSLVSLLIKSLKCDPGHYNWTLRAWRLPAVQKIECYLLNEAMFNPVFFKRRAWFQSHLHQFYDSVNADLNRVAPDYTCNKWDQNHAH